MGPNGTKYVQNVKTLDNNGKQIGKTLEEMDQLSTQTTYLNTFECQNAQMWT